MKQKILPADEFIRGLLKGEYYLTNYQTGEEYDIKIVKRECLRKEDAI